MSASLPKSSPSLSVATVPFPWITTSTEPFCRMYQLRPSSPWLNTAVKMFRDKREFKQTEKKQLKLIVYLKWVLFGINWGDAKWDISNQDISKKLQLLSMKLSWQRRRLWIPQKLDSISKKAEIDCSFKGNRILFRNGNGKIGCIFISSLMHGLPTIAFVDGKHFP